MTTEKTIDQCFDSEFLQLIEVEELDHQDQPVKNRLKIQEQVNRNTNLLLVIIRITSQSSFPPSNCVMPIPLFHKIGPKENPQQPDLIIIGSEKHHHVHTMPLACISPYFQKLIQYKNYRMTTDGMYQINMNDTPDWAIEMIIEFAYFGKVKIESQQQAEQLMVYADKYNIVGIIQMCHDVLNKSVC